jgi:hypothetical protein
MGTFESSNVAQETLDKMEEYQININSVRKTLLCKKGKVFIFFAISNLLYLIPYLFTSYSMTINLRGELQDFTKSTLNKEKKTISSFVKESELKNVTFEYFHKRYITTVLIKGDQKNSTEQVTKYIFNLLKTEHLKIAQKKLSDIKARFPSLESTTTPISTLHSFLELLHAEISFDPKLKREYGNFIKQLIHLAKKNQSTHFKTSPKVNKYILDQIDRKFSGKKSKFKENYSTKLLFQEFDNLTLLKRIIFIIQFFFLYFTLIFLDWRRHYENVN